MRNSLTAVLLVLIPLFAACSRSRVTTEIRPRGAWTRTVLLSGQEKKPGAMGTSIEETFALPAASEWTSHEDNKDSNRSLTFERTLAAGSALKGDVSIKGDAPGTLLMVNEVTVTRIAPDRFEYRETLRWLGPPPKSILIKPEDLARLKAALPPPLATDENAKALADRAGKLAIPLLFGPGEPLLALGLMHPDLAVRRAGQRMGGMMLKALEDQFGDKLPLAERREVARKLIETAYSQNLPVKPDPSAGTPPSNSSGLVALMFVVKSAGKIVSTNGEMDDLTGEVFWALYPEAASLEPVNLTAILQFGS